MGARPAGPACVNCGATETPLWRAGPAGPKTLCNACGVRWKKTGSVIPRSRRGTGGAGAAAPDRPAAAPPPAPPPAPPGSIVGPNTITTLVAPLPRRGPTPLHGAIVKHRSRSHPGHSVVLGGIIEATHSGTSVEGPRSHAASAAAGVAAAAAAGAATSGQAHHNNTHPAGAFGSKSNRPHVLQPSRVQYDSIFSGLMVVRARAQSGSVTGDLPRPPVPCPSPPPGPGPAGPAAVYVTVTHAPSPSPSPPPLPRYNPKGFSMLLAAAAETKEEL